MSISVLVKKSLFFKHPTKLHTLERYLILVIIVVAYLIFSVNSLGIEYGLLATVVTWAFLVFCTPIADAGFLIDFPVRLVTKVRMVYVEIVVWAIALIVTTTTFFLAPEIYSKTILLQLFHYIIVNPFPYALIIVLSAIGTFLSVYFGDELIDVASHEKRKKFHKHFAKHQLIIFAFIIIMIVIIYNFLLQRLGVTIPLW